MRPRARGPSARAPWRRSQPRFRPDEAARSGRRTGFSSRMAEGASATIAPVAARLSLLARVEVIREPARAPIFLVSTVQQTPVDRPAPPQVADAPLVSV